MSNELIDRNDRETESRDENERPEEWKPSRLLPDPPESKDVDYRWVRSNIRGRDDSANVSRKLREGWSFVQNTPEMLKRMRIICDIKSNYPEYIESSGNILMCRAKTISIQVKKAMSKKAQDQIDAIDNDLMKLNDSRMPLFSDRKSTVTYGGGRKG